jgi:hypothetical protein
MILDCMTWQVTLLNGFKMFTDRLLITKQNDFNYFRGNQYTKIKLLMVKLKLLLHNMKFDTLSNGRIV